MAKRHKGHMGGKKKHKKGHRKHRGGKKTKIK